MERETDSLVGTHCDDPLGAMLFIYTDLISEIFQHIPPNCAFHCLSVCKGYQSLLHRSSIWGIYLSEHFDVSVPFPSAEILKSHYVKSFDTSFNTKEVHYDSTNECQKLSDYPDISYVIGAHCWNKGRHKWSFQVMKLSDELRLGFTKNPNLKHGYYHTLGHPDNFIYSDGGGIYHNGKQVSDSPAFDTGDMITIELRFAPDYKVLYFKNMELVATLPIPECTSLYPLVALDAKNDRVKIISHI